MKKNLALLLALVFVLSVSFSTIASAADNSDAIAWDETVDFLVVGYGFAGQAAALEGSDIDADAKILVLEKMNEKLAGGNSIASGQTFIVPSEKDIDRFANYLKEMGYPNQLSDEYYQTLAAGFAALPQWMDQMVTPIGYEVGYVGGGPGRWGSYVVEFPEFEYGLFEGASLHVRTAGGPTFELGGIWHGLNKAVKTRENVEVRYGTFATELIQDDTGRVLGAVASDWNGNEIKIKSEKGVVLACGGFENNLQMQKDFHGLEDATTAGTPGNTGDGMEMLLKAGAKLWHVKNATQSGGFNIGFRVPEYEAGFILNMSIREGGYMHIAADSKRFINEAYPYYRQHLKHVVSGRYEDIPYERSQPVHMIFDDSICQNYPLSSTWVGWNVTTEGYVWDTNNAKELEKGWIMKADTLEELATMMDRDPATVVAEVERYNSMIDKGVDEDFGRDIATMTKIEKGPFYAIKLTPALVATTGGGMRNAKGEVLDWDNNVIPGLYEAGELGSTFSNLYQNGGFISEAFFSGRAAAQTAFGGAAEITSTYTILDPAEIVTDSIFKDEIDGEYIIDLEGQHGAFSILVKISVGKVASIQIEDGADNMYLKPEQVQEIANNVMAKQTTEVDAISGATEESQLILDGIKTQFKD